MVFARVPFTLTTCPNHLISLLTNSNSVPDFPIFSHVPSRTTHIMCHNCCSWTIPSAACLPKIYQHQSVARLVRSRLVGIDTHHVRCLKSRGVGRPQLSPLACVQWFTVSSQCALQLSCRPNITISVQTIFMRRESPSMLHEVLNYKVKGPRPLGRPRRLEQHG